MRKSISAVRPSSNALLFILVTICIDAIGFGIIIPVIPKLIEELTGGGIAEAAIYGGWLMAVFSLFQFFAAPILGNLSDRYGRRPVLLLSLVAFGIDFLVTGFAPNITWLFLMRVLAGVFGATHPIASAFIADVSEPSKRARNFGFVGAAFSFGFIIGPTIGGALGEFGPRVPFFAAAGLAFANAAFGYFILPESLKPEDRRPFSLKRANPFGALAAMRQYSFVLALVGGIVLMQIAGMTLPATWPYYTMLKFGWSEADVGFSLALIGALGIVVQGGLVSRVARLAGESGAVYIGLVFTTVGFIGFALATESWMLLAVMAPAVLGGIAQPALVSLMTSQVPSNAQGELQGALSSLNSLTMIVTPLLMTQVFSYFSSDGAPIHLPGAPYILAAILSAGSLILIARAVRREGSIGSPLD